MKRIINHLICATLLVGSAYASAGINRLPNGERFGLRQAEGAIVTLRDGSRAERRMTDLTKDKVRRSVKQRERAESRSPQLKLQEIRPLAEGGNARITLVVQKDWGDGTGYQILLDADATIYQDYIENDPAQDDAVYNEVEYKLPTYATSYGGYLIAGERGSIDIPDGTYDYVVLNPSFTGIYIVKNGDVAGDDVHFEAGNEYVFTIDNDGESDNCVMSMSSGIDLAVTAITSPTNGYLTEAETVTATISNRGIREVQEFTVSYQIDGGTPVIETVKQAIAPGAEMSYSFEAKGDFSEGKIYEVKVQVECEGDVTADNNEMTVSVNHIHPLSLPYYCGFDEDSDVGEWTIIDANGDGTTWYIDTSWGQAICEYSWDYYDTDDYLVTASPITLGEGTNHVTVTYNGYDYGYYESFEILYGSTSEVGEMAVLKSVGDFEYAEENYVVSVDFDVEQAGDYFFAIHGTSKADQYGLVIEDILIDAGSHMGTPDMIANRVDLPLSNCSLGSEESASVLVSNMGTADVTAFDIECFVDGVSVGTQTVNEVVGTRDSLSVGIDAPIDLSAPGVHTVKVAISNVVQEDGNNPEEAVDNNTVESTVTHFTPTDVPFNVDFSDAEQRGEWAGANSWLYSDSYKSMYCIWTEPLLSRGVNLEAGKTYRLSYTYMAGMWVDYFTTIKEDYDVLCGIDGEDPLQWEPLVSYKEVYTEEAFTNEKIIFTVPEDGIYQFGFYQSNPYGTMSVGSVSISEMFDYDVRVGDVKGMPSMLPVSQQGKFNLSAVVHNEGSEAVAGNVTVTIGGVVVGQSEFAEIESNGYAEVQLEIDLALAKLQTGSTNVEVKAVVDGHDDGNMADNAVNTTLVVNDDTLAYDYTTDEKYSGEYAIGVGAGSATAAIAMHISASARLEAFSLGWGAELDQELAFYVYEWDSATKVVGDLVYQGTASKGTGMGQMEYAVDKEIVMQPGDYLAAVTFAGYSLVCDFVMPGQLYMLATDQTGRVVALDQSQQGLGTPAIRLILGEAVSSIGENEMAGTTLRIYPNPASDMLVIKSSGEIGNVAVFSISGAEVCNEQVSGNEFRLDVSGYASGVYVVKVATTTGIEVRRFIVK